jgi:hypothetical protein
MGRFKQIESTSTKTLKIKFPFKKIKKEIDSEIDAFMAISVINETIDESDNENENVEINDKEILYKQIFKKKLESINKEKSNVSEQKLMLKKIYEKECKEVIKNLRDIYNIQINKIFIIIFYLQHMLYPFKLF